MTDNLGINPAYMVNNAINNILTQIKNDPVFTPEYVFLSILLIVTLVGLAASIGLLIGTIISNWRKK